MRRLSAAFLVLAASCSARQPSGPDPAGGVPCELDTDCRPLPCGPCEHDTVITLELLRLNCLVNPCPNPAAYCATTGVCAVK